MSKTLWADAKQIAYSTVGMGGGTMLIDDGGACIGYVVVLNKDATIDRRALDLEVYRAVKDRTLARQAGEPCPLCGALPCDQACL